METIAQTAEGPVQSATASGPQTGGFNATALRQTACNVGIAFIFFAALWAHARNYHSYADIFHRMRHYGGLADLVWMVGAALMGVLSLIRVPPVASMVNFRSILATTAMIVAPAFIKAQSEATGMLALAGLAIECFGVIVSEGSRIYLGRRFGFLPANRGIVSTGPFALVRHPIYSGWFVLTLGLVMAYPTPRNLLMLALTAPVMVLRIDLEEQLLSQDPEYRAYCAKTRYRLIPFIY
jgi:protein-S-isoprenylcysteine O-methyltransferase Ste14